MKWVKNNIRNFGGDPDNVTLFGESAGGSSTHFHTISEHSRGLFNRAIPMSGCAFNKTWNCYDLKPMVKRLVTALGHKEGDDEKVILKFLEEVDPEEIVKASGNLLIDEEIYKNHFLFSFGPTIEPYVSKNCFIPKDPVLMAREAWGNDIDVLIGGCSNEGLLIGFFVNFMKLDLRKMFEKFYNNLPLELAISCGSEKSVEYAKMLKKLYYGCTEPSVANLQGYFYVHNMNFFIVL